MSQQWMRYCKVTWPNGSFTLDDPNNNLRVRFKVTGWTSQTPMTGTITITNPNPKLGTQLKNWLGKEITIDAGYQNCHGLVFKGQIVQAFYGRESPTDTILVINAGSEVFAHGAAIVNQTFPRGSTPQDHVNAAVAAMNKISPLKIGFIGIDLTKPQYPRAVTLFKSATAILGDIARAAGANHSTQNGKLHIVKDKQTVPGGPVVLNSKTGLIGMPSQTMSGIMARCLINPNVYVNSQVKIDQKDISQGLAAIQHGPTADAQLSTMPEIAADGLYKVIQLAMDADTRGNPWYMDLTLLSVSGVNIGNADVTASGVATGSPA